jgi:hypothetical protein
MQIIAELDRQHIEKLQTLEKILKKNTSELISFAIDEIFTNNSEVKQCAETDDAVPNELTQAAMRDVRAKINLENITLEQLQRDYDVV